MSSALAAAPWEATGTEGGPRRSTPWGEWIAQRLDPGWRTPEWRPQSRVFLGDVDNPMTAAYACAVERCVLRVDNFGTRCTRCRRRWIASGKPSDFDAAFDPAEQSRLRHKSEPGARCGDFSLTGLHPTVVSELIVGLQQRDAAQIVLVPAAVRRAVARLPVGCASILDVSEDVVDSMPGNGRGVFRDIRARVRHVNAVYAGIDVTGGDVWDAALVGLQAAPDRRYPATAGVIDFRSIRQPWLRELIKTYAREARPTVTDLHRIIDAAEVASAVLLVRPNGLRPEQLGASDMAAIQRDFARLNCSISHRRAKFGWWRRVIGYCRRSGAMDHIPGSFAVDPEFGAPKPAEASAPDRIRAIPEPVIAQLDTHLDELGRASSFIAPGWGTDDFAHMYRTYYQLLRDTGRRPGEIDTLKRSSLEWESAKPVLVYDNHKRRRLGRRLPITDSTATIVRGWLDHLDTLSAVPGTEQWMFPAPGARNRPRRTHMRNGFFQSKVMSAWLARLPELSDRGLDDGGHPLVYPKESIDLYGFRHAYAQRHADAGTPVDVLRELMDHRSVDVTMGYYRIPIERKRAAAEAVARYAVDRHGAAAGFSDPLAYERESVAVPFGNCTEPSNIAAGGGHCPIRFQCSGCNFYRPDPSYIPAIEQHVAQLREDRELALAGGSADWVISNLDAQITSFLGVVDAMCTGLGHLTDTERALVEEASKQLRKARQAAALIPAEALTARLDREELPT